MSSTLQSVIDEITFKIELFLVNPLAKNQLTIGSVTCIHTHIQVIASFLQATAQRPVYNELKSVDRHLHMELWHYLHLVVK